MPLIRILVADDYSDWRRRVGVLLQPRPEFQIVAEVSDGSEAIQKAEDLKPDLILLDIGLPKLDGIEAALRIREVSPSSRIVFLSQNSDPDIVRAALDAGASGYVRKIDSHNELLPAIDAALRGQRFVSSSFSAVEFLGSRAEKSAHRHEVLFYPNDRVLLDTFARFIAGPLKAGEAAIAIIAKPHAEGFLQSLKLLGVDTEGALRQGRYIQLDVAETLSTYMVNDMPDPARFFEVVTAVIERALKASQNPRIVACGEGAPTQLAEGKVEAAIRVEQLWDELVATFNMDTICGYASTSFQGGKREQIFQSICGQHSAVLQL